MSREIMDLPAPPADRRLVYGPDPLHFADLRLPWGAGPHPVVVMVHGGFWRARRDLQYIGHLGAALTAAGFATWNVEYRRIGNAGGGWPGTLQDVARATDHLRVVAGEYPLDLERVMTLGHSAGGHLALWLAARQRIPAGDVLHSAEPLRLCGAVALGGVADLRAASDAALSEGITDTFIGGRPEDVPERYATASPAELLPLGVPQVLIHGTLDEDVPYTIARDYQARATRLGDPARLVTLEGMGHFEPVDPRSAAWPAVVEAVKALIG